MSQPATEPPGGGQRPRQGKKVLGMNRGTAIGVGVVGLAVIVIVIIRLRSKAASSSSTTAAPSTGSCPDGSTPDANGNCPQDSTDFSGQLANLEAEIAALQGAGASGGGGSAGSVGAATGTTTTAPAPAATTTTTPATTPATAPKAAAGPISNLQPVTTGTTTATIRWNAAQGATGGYVYQYAEVGKGEGTPHPTRATTATLTGLKPKTTYNFGVQALPGGAGNNVHFTTK